MNFTDILGSVLNQGMTRSGGNRIDHSMSNSGLGGIGDILSSLGGSCGGSGGGIGGGASGGSPIGGLSGGSMGGLGDILGSVLGGGGSGGNNALITGGLGALAGALFGGGGSSVKGALGGSALAMLGGLALKALQNRGGAAPDASAQLMAGLRAPETAAEEREVQSISELTIKAMFNAAKADGQVDQDEIQRIVGKVAEDGLTQEERDFVTSEMNRPMDTDGLIRAVPNAQVAAQVYAASLLAIEVDTDAERDYLRTLAAGLGLDREVVGQLQGTLGVA